MALPRSLLQYVCGLVLFVACAQALKFELQATSQSHDTRRERCVRNFVQKDTLVVVTATVSGTKGDGMRVNMHVSHPSTGAWTGLESPSEETTGKNARLISQPDQRRAWKRVRKAAGRRG